MFDGSQSEPGPAAAAVERIGAATRAENAAAGARLVAIGDLDTVRAREPAAREHWAIDPFEAVAAEVSAALEISPGLAGSYLSYARALRDRLPKVGGLLQTGIVSYWMFRTIVYRTDLIEDPAVLAAVDTTLAARIPRWPGLSQARLAGHIDKIVARADRDALRQRREFHADREIVISDLTDGLAEINGRLVGTDAHALDARLDALTATVCENDPRTRAQRRADALGALAAGAEKLSCRCGNTDCPAAGVPGTAPVLIHVIAEQASLDATSDTPGSLIGADTLIPPELLRELAETARQRPLTHPGDTPPEAGYTPSRALADFVRCRDLTCRFPGCDEPAANCDIDHTVPHSQGGPTHASNLSCKCRKHHLIKTFLGWRDQQLPDGTLIWTAPTGHIYVTTPGSALLFPSLCVPTGPLPSRSRQTESGNRTVMMPTRRQTRAEGHARYIAAERRTNLKNRLARQAARDAYWAPYFSSGNDYGDDEDPPPF